MRAETFAKHEGSLSDAAGAAVSLAPTAVKTRRIVGGRRSGRRREETGRTRPTQPNLTRRQIAPMQTIFRTERLQRHATTTTYFWLTGGGVGSAPRRGRHRFSGRRRRRRCRCLR